MTCSGVAAFVYATYAASISYVLADSYDKGMRASKASSTVASECSAMQLDFSTFS